MNQRKHYKPTINHQFMPLTDQHGDYIELNTFLKIKGVADSGGKAKHLIKSEKVKVNNEIETRNRKKLRNNDRINVNNQEFVVDLKEF